jgi:hypothetical protein
MPSYGRYRWTPYKFRMRVAALRAFFIESERQPSTPVKFENIENAKVTNARER